MRSICLLVPIGCNGLHSCRPPRATVTAGVPIPPAGDAMIEKYLGPGRRPARQGGCSRPTATRDEWEAIRPRLKAELFQMLGLWPVPERTPLHATVTGTLEREGPVVIEKLHFQSRPGLYVTGNLYRPRARPAASCRPSSTSAGMRAGAATATRRPSRTTACGSPATAMSPCSSTRFSSARSPASHHGTYNLGRWWWQAVGYTPAGVECWNGIRAIDYLLTRPDVDPARIGVTGISGGGADHLLDRRGRRPRGRGRAHQRHERPGDRYVSHKVINGHCDCMFMYQHLSLGVDDHRRADRTPAPALRQFRP